MVNVYASVRRLSSFCSTKTAEVVLCVPWDAEFRPWWNFVTRCNLCSEIMPKKNYRIVTKGDAVRRARIVAGLTSAELAREVNISRPMLSSIENGAGTSVKTAHRIADALNCGFSDLFEINSL